MAKPGRNALGKFATNDATAAQFAEAVIAAVGCLGASVWMHAEQRAEFDGFLETARATAPLLDAGTRPTTEHVDEHEKDDPT